MNDEGQDAPSRVEMGNPNYKQKRRSTKRFLSSQFWKRDFFGKEVLKLDGGSIAGVFALSSAICCHLISRRHYGVTRSWIVNKWFWAGFFGSLPALVAFVAHVYLSRGRSN